MSKRGGLLVAVAALALALPARASAHAVLEQTHPVRGASLERSPQLVWFRFNEPVEASFGAVRAYDRSGERVDSGELVRPAGAESVGVALEPDLGDGLYTATYRVISADAHPVSGGFTFTVGDPGRGAAVALDELIDDAGAGAVADGALGVARVVSYVATALLIGGVFFCVLAWAPALSTVAGGSDRWQRAANAFGGRLRRMLTIAIAIGAAATAIGIVLQGAVGLGESFWRALRPAVVEEVLTTRFGTAWGLRLVDLALLAALLLVPALAPRYGALVPARLGATGAAATDPLPRSRVAVTALGLALGFLALVPGLSGHAGVVEPTWLGLPANFVHVFAFALWAGGLVTILACLPAATGELEGVDKSRLLAASVARFSTVALASVAALLATGIVQSLIELESWGDLLESGYGRAILVKAALLAALVALGALNRRRLLPALDAVVARAAAPGEAGVALRRSIRAEVLLIGGVLAATATLAALAPPASTQAGPFATTAELGSARVELTVDPAVAGRNQVHLYLFERETGAPYTAVKELRLDAALAERDVGPLRLDARNAGPGHYVVRGAELGIEGEWTLAVGARVSAFEQIRALIEVPIR